MHEKKPSVIDNFEIPEDLAKDLSDLLIKQTIKERLLLQVLDEQDKYDQIESMLIPIAEKIQLIKIKITKDYVPDKYNSKKYSWNYNSWEIDKNKVEIIEAI